MDKLKKSGMDMDMSIEQMDWVEDNKKVSNPIELHFMISYLYYFKFNSFIRILKYIYYM